MDTHAPTSVHTALREATIALRCGRDAHAGDETLSRPAYKLLSADLASTLDAATALLRAVGVGPAPCDPVSQNLHALLQRMASVAALARAIADTDHDGLGPARTTTRPDA